jgi:MFS family permease
MRTRTLQAARRTYPALGVHNYRLYFVGHIISVSGTWMQTIALTWLVLKLSDSGFVLGLTAALQYLPLLFLGPLAGVLVDRMDKRRLLFVTQSAAATLAMALAVLTLSGVVQIWMVIAFALALGFVNALDVPTRQTFAYELVGPGPLPNAITLNSVIMNAGRVVGPAMAGVAIATVGLGVCFLLNGLSYLTLIVGLLLMRRHELFTAVPVPRQKGQLREGLRYAWATPAVRAPLLVMALIGTFTYEFQVMLPLLARFTFDSDAGGFSFLMAAMGVGSVLSGLLVATRLRPSARRLGWAGLLLGALVVLAGSMPTLTATAVVLFAVGGASIAFLTLANATLQLTAAPAMRGRVIALYAVAFLGSIPIGGPVMGFIGGTFGARTALLIAGTIALVTIGLSWRSLARTSTELHEVQAAPAGVAAPDRGPAPSATPELGPEPESDFEPALEPALQPDRRPGRRPDREAELAPAA